MADNFHDIIPPEKRSIRNVTTTHRHPRRNPRRSPEEVEGHIPPPPNNDGGKSRFGFLSRYGLWIIAVIVIIIFVLAFSLLFSGSAVTVTPKERDVFIDGEFEAFRNASVGQLPYEVVSFTRTASKTVPATGEAAVEDRASGQVIVFNNFNEEEQRLITNTRFETPDGLIYRIDQPVVVPGQSSENGDIVPGSIEVTVYADEPGERYNIGLTDFTIPGFEGGPRFEGFYARSKTPMSGGFVGTRLTASESDVESARAELRTQLERELREQARAELPEGFHLFDDAVFMSFESPISGESNSAVEVYEKGTLYATLFRGDELARFVAGSTIAGYEGEPIAMHDPETLSFTVLDRNLTQPWIDDSISFTLTGNVRMVWRYDEVALRADLAGRAKDALPTILSGYPSIQEAEVSLRPFWRQTFPEDTEDITIEQMLAE